MLKAIVDSINGNYARVLIGDEGVAVAIHTSHLPPRIHDGAVLQVKFTLDQAATMAHEKNKKALAADTD
ncbi:MAG TPA: DUF3006 domain-containing protein [Armatimonadota bacterium]